MLLISLMVNLDNYSLISLLFEFIIDIFLICKHIDLVIVINSLIYILQHRSEEY
jgi:hypothetical protein